MNILLTIFICVYWFEFLQVPRRYPILNLKPFSCEICLPLWICGISIFIPDHIIEAITMIVAAGVLTPIILRLIKKI